MSQSRAQVWMAICLREFLCIPLRLATTQLQLDVRDYSWSARMVLSTKGARKRSMDCSSGRLTRSRRACAVQPHI